MINYVAQGDDLDLAAPYDRLSGQGAQVGQLFGVASVDVLSTVVAAFKTTGVFDLVKVGSQAWATIGALVYWDNTNKRCTTTATGNLLIGAVMATTGAGAGETTGRVRLNGTVRANEP